MRSILTLSLVFSTIRLATPLVWAAIGGLYSERSGVINIALEGLMLAGAFTAAATTYYTHSPWVGLGSAMLAAAFFAFLLAILAVGAVQDKPVVATAPSPTPRRGQKTRGSWRAPTGGLPTIAARAWFRSRAIWPAASTTASCS